MRKIDNPFLVSGYESPDYFCDRVRETEKLLDALRNGRNVTMLAPRRMGKTGLIKNVFHALNGAGEWKTIYVDMFAAQDLPDFTRRFASAVIGSMDSRIDRALTLATRFFKSIRPVVSVDAVTGGTSYSFTLDAATCETTLKECFDYLDKAERRVVVAIDEFQQVAEFPEKGTEALLRSYIQFMPHVRFIFAGSKRHLIADMFSLPKRPFYNSTQMFPLGTIPADAYYEFAARHLASGGVRLEREVFDGVYARFDGVTWYVQVILNRLYGYRSATAEDVQRAIGEIIEENEYNYGNLLESYPEGAVRLLRAIAAEGSVRAINAASFLARHALRGTSSVNLSLARLRERNLVDKSEKGYFIDDRFFGLWLSQQGR